MTKVYENLALRAIRRRVCNFRQRMSITSDVIGVLCLFVVWKIHQNEIWIFLSELML
jgi:hypothetical protein